jgi:hypothetical protein
MFAGHVKGLNLNQAPHPHLVAGVEVQASRQSAKVPSQSSKFVGTVTAPVKLLETPA